jgi:hypothetical protein
MPMIRKLDLNKQNILNKYNDYYRFSIKNNLLRNIFRDLLSLGVYLGSANPLRIIPFTETSADVAFLQTHIGCRQNTCTFCPFYKDLKYQEKDGEQILWEIDRISEYYRHKNDRNISRVMLLDANAVDMEHSKLVRIIRYLRDNFPRYRKKEVKILHWDEHEKCFYTEQMKDKKTPVEVSSFVHTETILKKGVDFYRDLKKEGLTMLWWGVESGCEVVIDWNTHYAQQITNREFDILSPSRMLVQRRLLESVVPDSIKFDYDLENYLQG